MCHDSCILVSSKLILTEYHYDILLPKKTNQIQSNKQKCLWSLRLIIGRSQWSKKQPTNYQYNVTKVNGYSFQPSYEIKVTKRICLEFEIKTFF